MCPGQGRNKILYFPADMSLSKTIEVINVVNELGNLFQLVISGVSCMRSWWNGSQEKELKEEDVKKLQDDLRCLVDTLPIMYNLIDQAEWRIHEPFVAQQLPKLKDAVSDADDLLDEFIWYKQKVSVDGNENAKEPVINFFRSVIQGSFNKVKEIQKRLENLSSPLGKMGLHQTTPRFDKLVRPETTSFPTEAKIFGRDKEMKELIKLLGVPANNSKGPSRYKKPKIGDESSANIQVYDISENNEATITSVPVLPIVGIGGVGKTTLAQNVCNHPKVKSHFYDPIWICVSDDFDVKRLTKEALQSLSSNKGTGTDNLDSLQRELSNSVKCTRLLLILDDMWDDALKENGQSWKRFIAPFTNALHGSMILVTTRLQKVADLVGTIDSFPLDGLNDDVYWDFFKQCVFGSDRSNYDPELNRIGMEILPKLRGSPLAAKTLGRLLGMSFDRAHWDMILKSQLWELSQEETDILPALRLSYMYLPFHLKRCFSFCATYPKDYNFEKEDLAEIWVAEGFVQPQPNVPLQHTSCRYFDELEHLSFFQKRHGKYVIHDLMHDMAQLVSKDECFIIKNIEDLQKIPENVRHVSVLKSSGVKCSDLQNLYKHKKLRTLLCNMSLKSRQGDTVMQKWCTELLCMRVIVCDSISKWGLPDSISNMKHLRYLKILDSCLFRRLPETFCCLYNLQILYAKKCMIDNIPRGFGTLTNLQKFESSTYQFRHEHSVNTRGGATSEGQKWLFKFRSYHGESPPDGFNPENLPSITSLSIEDCNNIKCISFSMNSEQIHSYDSIGSTFSYLTDVEIVFCNNLSSPEQFLQPACVPDIRKITISYCPNLESVPTERFGEFSVLEVLNVFSCPKISSRRLFARSLKRLYVRDSGKLVDNIECSSLTILELLGGPMASIELQMWNLPSLKELKICQCSSLTTIRDSEQISTDIFHGGDDRGGMVKFPLLTQLIIENCSNLETIDDLLYLPAIEKIYIEDCALVSLPTERLGNYTLVKDLHISKCPSLGWQSGMLLPSSLQNLGLSSCGDFSAWFPRCLENLSALKSLQICSCEWIVSVPGHLWSTSLKSLERLQFYNCPNLVSVGGPNATANIRVTILGCPKCEEICSKEKSVRKSARRRSVRK